LFVRCQRRSASHRSCRLEKGRKKKEPFAGLVPNIKRGRSLSSTDGVNRLRGKKGQEEDINEGRKKGKGFFRPYNPDRKENRSKPSSSIPAKAVPVHPNGEGKKKSLRVIRKRRGENRLLTITAIT